MGRKPIRPFLFAVVVTASLAVSTRDAAAAPSVLHVPGDYSTIQAAVDAAPAGGTVLVGAGTFVEQVVINKNLALRGAGAVATIIQSPATLVPHGVNVRNGLPLHAIVRVGHGAHVAISGVAVTGPLPCGAVVGIHAIQGANVDVSDARVSNMLATDASCARSTFGITYGAAPFVVIDGVAGSWATGRVSHTVVDAFQNTGIFALAPFGGPATKVMIAGNVVNVGAPHDPAETTGIDIFLNAVARVSGNTVTGGLCTFDGCGFDPISEFQSFGVFVGPGGDGSSFTDNHASGADVGIYDYNSAVTINGNTLTDNNFFGIAIQDIDGVTKDNTITGGRVGIGVAADSQDTTELSKGDHISGYSDTATQTFECCGFHATVTVLP